MSRLGIGERCYYKIFKREAIKVKIERTWHMPSKDTFKIKPIKKLIYNASNNFYGLWIDPFAGYNSPAKITNDLNEKIETTYHMNAIDFLKMFSDNSVDGVLFDPPYSNRQVKECYTNIGTDLKFDGKTNFWSEAKDEISRIVKPNGTVICFGWNSVGISKSRGFKMIEMLVVCHGGVHNDTICTVEVKNENRSMV